MEVDNIEGKFQKLADRCKQKGVMVCATYLKDPSKCKKGNACQFLHYDQSLSDKAIAAAQNGNALPMDLHKKPRNTVIVGKPKKDSQA